MKYYFLNKVAMAVLVALLLFFGTRTLIDIVYQEHPPEKPGYEVAGTKDDAHGEKKKAKVDESAAFILALNKADPAKGEQDVGLCKVCHSFDKGGPTMIGPNIYGVVGHKIAAIEGVNYTPALKDHGGDWTFEDLDKWLKNPQEFAPGTSMAFPGIPDIQKRANVVAYLNKNSDDPLPIPEPKEAPAPEEAADGGDDDAAAGPPEVITLLATADAAKGEQAAALCKVCHTFDEGGATMVGPNLHNVVGADIAHHEAFNYSAGLKDKGGSWTYEQLDAWLANPQAFAPGTTMAFPGVPDAKKRADIIAFLMSHTDNPPPLPKAEEKAAPAEEAKPAEEAAPAEEPAAAEEEAAPAEEPAAEEPAAEEPAAEEPAAMEETISNPPTVSEDAPSEPHAGEAPSPNQPQPVVPSGASNDGAINDGSSSGSMAPAGDDGLSSQPQPVYPDGEPGDASGSDSSDSAGSSSGDTSSSQPQPVYPDGPPPGL